MHTRNRTPTSALGGETPYFHWKGKKPDISYFRIFGCLAYVLIHQKHRKALQPHSRKCIFVGYPEGVKAWRFWDPVDKKFIISSHAIFDERCFPGNSTSTINLLGSPVISRHVPQSPRLVVHQGGEDSHSESDNDDPPPIVPIVQNQNFVPPAPPTPPPAPAPLQLSTGTAPHHTTPVLRQNPPQSTRFTGSLNESKLRERTWTPPTAPPPTSVSPDPLLMSPPPPPATPAPPVSSALPSPNSW